VVISLFTLAAIGALAGVTWHYGSKIMATQAELAAQLIEITAQNEKARTEILAKVADLEAAIETAGSTTPEVDAALAALKASVQADDDLNPDAPEQV
jgi:hypothetical protein